MVTLEGILKSYFGCKVPFRENGEPTKEGGKAARKLLYLLKDCTEIGILPHADLAEQEMDYILRSYKTKDHI